MPKVCANPWDFAGCEPTFEYLWRWTVSWERWVLYALGLMFVYVGVAVIQISYRFYSAKRAERSDATSEGIQRATRNLLAEVIPRAAVLQSVAVGAPYLGSLGACFGVLGMFRPIAMSRAGVLQMLVSALDAAFLSTAAGLIVAAAATWGHNFVRTRIELLKKQVSGEQGNQDYRLAQSLPLAPKFSRPPAIGIVAALILAVAVATFMTFPSFVMSRGLRVGVASVRCSEPSYEHAIILHLTRTGKILINTEEEDWNRLAVRLSEIYHARGDRTLYLVADHEVLVKTVADAIDIANGISFADTSDHVSIRVKLITPAAMQAHCLDLTQSQPVPKLDEKSRRP